MKITSAHVETMLQHLFELGERAAMTPVPQSVIVRLDQLDTPRFRAWIRPLAAETDIGKAVQLESIPYYEGTQKQCSHYLAEQTMRIALEKVFGGGEASPDEPRDSLPQTDGEPQA